MTSWVPFSDHIFFIYLFLFFLTYTRNVPVVVSGADFKAIFLTNMTFCLTAVV